MTIDATELRHLNHRRELHALDASGARPTRPQYPTRSAMPTTRIEYELTSESLIVNEFTRPHNEAAVLRVLNVMLLCPKAHAVMATGSAS
jgi:hypothetical protein